MKTWITYLAAFLMGLATCLLFKSYPASLVIFGKISSYFINLMVFLYIPFVFITFFSAIGSLKKDNVGGKTARAIFFWSIFSSLILSVLAFVLFYFFPISLPISSTAGTSSSLFLENLSASFTSAKSLLLPINPFNTLSSVTSFIVPVILISWIFGLALKPSSDVIRPAYTVLNSFSEVMYRVSKTVAVFSSVLVYIFSTYLFLKLWEDKTLLVSPTFSIILVSSFLSLLIIILPFIFALFTLFKKNPYSALFRSIPTLLMALSTQNILSTFLIGTSIERQNLGIQKRITSVSFPSFLVIGRGGTAFISTLLSLMLLKSLNAELTLLTHFFVALSCFLFSFLSSMAVGYETIFVVYMALSFLKINIGSSFMTLFGLLPFINGLSITIDTYIGILGSLIIAKRIKTDIKVPYKDTI